MEHLTDLDHKNLILEAYRIDGITDSQCRSIFLDWALSLKPGLEAREAIRLLLAHYGAENAQHPMTAVLRAGLDDMAKPRRRGGWRSRSR